MFSKATHQLVGDISGESPSTRACPNPTTRGTSKSRHEFFTCANYSPFPSSRHPTAHCRPRSGQQSTAILIACLSLGTVDRRARAPLARTPRYSGLRDTRNEASGKRKGGNKPPGACHAIAHIPEPWDCSGQAGGDPSYSPFLPQSWSAPSISTGPRRQPPRPSPSFRAQPLKSH